MNIISIEQAREELAKLVAEHSIEDAIYELAFNAVSKEINKVEEQFCIVDTDGVPCNSCIDTGDTMWYDDVRETMMNEIYQKVKSFLQ